MSLADVDEDLLTEPDDDILARSSRRSFTTRPNKRGNWGWIVAAVVVGIFLGTWIAGRPSTSATEGSSATPSASQASDESQLRQAELTAWLKQYPDDADAHLELGVLLFNAGDSETARAHWETVLSLDPASASAYYNLGFYYLALDEPDYLAAYAVWGRVVELAPDSELAESVASHMAALPIETGGALEDTSNTGTTNGEEPI